MVYAAAVSRVLASLEVDLVHDHCLAGPLLARGRGRPTVVTMHGRGDAEHGDIMAALGDTVQVVAISDAQRRDRGDINWVATVHNAIDVEQYPFAPEKDDVVLWMGRFTADKAPGLAIDAARAAGVPIVLAGKCSEPAEQEFFDTEIAPRLGDGRGTSARPVVVRSGSCARGRERCCSRSSGRSRSASSCSRRWHAVPPSSPPAAAACRRSWRTASTAWWWTPTPGSTTSRGHCTRWSPSTRRGAGHPSGSASRRS